MENTQIVYWSHLASEYKHPTINLLQNVPKKLLQNLAKNKHSFTRAYTNCIALHNQMSNTFYVEFPFDIDIEIEDKNNINGNKSDWFNRNQVDHFVDRQTADLDMGWFFYSPEPLELEILPPFAHKTEASKHGVVAHGSFDIGQWFRPIKATHILWEGINKFKAKENDPILYAKFHSKKQIILKQFIPTDKLLSYADACTNYSDVKYFKISLKKRYDQFKISNMQKMVLKEIQNNLVDDE